MIYLIDNDAIKKLAQYNLLTELCSAYDVQPNNFAVLPELKFQLKLKNKPKAVEKLGDESSFNRLVEFLKLAQEVIVHKTDSANEILKLNQSNLDFGEQTLLAALSSNAESKMLSGDKRAFHAISKIEKTNVLSLLWPRFICLEEALHRILHNNDFSIVSNKVRSKPSVDNAIKIAFGVSNPSNRESVVCALSSYIQSLIESTNGLYEFTAS
jgi:hypothetical protein